MLDGKPKEAAGWNWEAKRGRRTARTRTTARRTRESVMKMPPSSGMTPPMEKATSDAMEACGAVRVHSVGRKPA